MTQRLPLAVPIAPMVIGALLALTGLVKPAFLWNTGKVIQGRAWIGDTGVTLFFVGIGVALMAAGIVAMRKLRAP